jgi:hypothetical protein
MRATFIEKCLAFASATVMFAALMSVLSGCTVVPSQPVAYYPQPAYVYGPPAVVVAPPVYIGPTYRYYGVYGGRGYYYGRR